MYTNNPRTQEAEAGGLWVLANPGKLGKALKIERAESI